MIKRTEWHDCIQTALRRSRILTLVGPRQCGKATLAREFVAEESVNYFDLEDPVSLARLDEPMTALGSLQGLIVIDEIQRRPELFSVLRVLVDRKSFAGQFLILGSASGDLLRQSSQTLAGRMDMLRLRGFSLQELGQGAQQQHWLRGSFPLSYLARSDADSLAWRKGFIQTLLERDFPQWGIRTDAPRITPSIRTALTELELDKVIVVYPGDKRFKLADRVEALPLKNLDELSNGVDIC